MRVEIPEGATDVYFARGKSLEKYDKESYLKGLHEGYPYNKTVTYSASDFGTNNVYTPTNWGAVHWYYCNTSGCEFGTKEHKITDGKWSSKTVEELAEELSMPELAEGYSFATVVMEPTDDDTSLSSLIINKTPVSISHRVVYTLPSILEDEKTLVYKDIKKFERESGFSYADYNRMNNPCYGQNQGVGAAIAMAAPSIFLSLTSNS